MHTSLRSFLLALTILTLAACAAPAAPAPTLTPEPTATATHTVEPTATLAPTATPVPPIATENPTDTPAPTETETVAPTAAATRVRPTVTPVPSPTTEVTPTSGSPEHGGNKVGDAGRLLDGTWIAFGIAVAITGSQVTVAFAQCDSTDIWSTYPGKVCGTRLINAMVMKSDGTVRPLLPDDVQVGDFLTVWATQEILEAPDGSGPYNASIHSWSHDWR
jgi:hypothetical protein